MLHTIKKNEKDFNLLFLEYNDYLLDTLKCHYFNTYIKSLYNSFKLGKKENFIWVQNRWFSNQTIPMIQLLSSATSVSPRALGITL